MLNCKRLITNEKHSLLNFVYFNSYLIFSNILLGIYNLSEDVLNYNNELIGFEIMLRSNYFLLLERVTEVTCLK